jgi:hypothetical protein
VTRRRQQRERLAQAPAPATLPEYASLIVRVTQEVHEDLITFARLAAVPPETVGAVLLALAVFERKERRR